MTHSNRIPTLPLTVNGLDPRGPARPITPTRHVTVPPVTPPTHSLPNRGRSVPEVSFPQPTIPLLDNLPIGLKRPDSGAEKATKALFEILSYPDGEIPVSLWC